MRNGESRQLHFVFADSPRREPGGGQGAAPGVPGAAQWLQHIAKGKASVDLTSQTGGMGRLLERVASVPNLARALRSVARNKGAAGVDGQSVGEVVENARRLLPILRAALLNGTYRPGDIRRVWIPKPGGGRRGLGIPNVIDRWVQEAVRRVLEPIFEPTFHASSHGFRPERGAATAIAQAKRYIAEGYSVVIDLDISKFFDRVNHQRLLSRLAQRVEDGRMLKLIDRMLKAKVVMPDGTKVAVGEGTPQGGPLSPLLSNVVLDELDWELERRGHSFVRYADDCNIYVRSRQAGQRVMGSIRRFIEGRLRLQLNAEKSSVSTPDQVHFLGFLVLMGRTGRHAGKVQVHLSQRSDQKMMQRIRELTRRTWGQSLDTCIAQINTYLRGWEGYFRLCTAGAAFRLHEYDGHIRRRLRLIIMRQKKRARHLYRHLRSRGVAHQAARSCAFCRRGPWYRSRLPGIQRAYPNAWFAGRLVSLYDLWRSHAPLEPQMASDGQLLLFV